MRKVDHEEMHLDDVIVNECDKWIIFGDTMSKGKIIIYFTTPI